MSEQTDDREAAEIADIVRQSELIAALGAKPVLFTDDRRRIYPEHVIDILNAMTQTNVNRLAALVISQHVEYEGGQYIISQWLQDSSNRHEILSDIREVVDALVIAETFKQIYGGL